MDVSWSNTRNRQWLFPNAIWTNSCQYFLFLAAMGLLVSFRQSWLKMDGHIAKRTVPIVDTQTMLTNSEGTIFGLGMSNGKIYQSTNDGTNWSQAGPDSLQQASQNFSYRPVLTIDRQGYLYYLMTDPYRLYRSINSTATGGNITFVEVPISPILGQNYPNPFNSTTRISFSLPKREDVSLSIYDELGRNVTTIIDRSLFFAGSHEVEWKAEKMASGTYFYRMKAGGQLETKRMTILK